MEGNDVLVVRDPLAAEKSATARRISWSAVFAGAVVSLGLWALLYVFGLAMGLTALDPNNPASAKGAGIGTGIWSAVAPLIALFVGSFLASRLSGTAERGAGASHGAVIWGLSTVGGVLLIGSLVSAVVGGSVKVGAKTLAGATDAATGVVGAAASQGGDVGNMLGIDANDLLAPVNRRLQAQGKPAVTAAQLQAVMRDVAGSAVRGNLDRPQLVQSIAQHTALDRADAEDLANQLDARFASFKQQGQNQLQQAGQTLQQTALEAGDSTGKVMWGVFGALALGLIAALGGGALGARTFPGHERTEPRRFPLTRPAEVHP